jgi:type II secretory pathway pseudopilin PulG
MKKLQYGFTAVEGLLILVIVGIMAGAGWYVWQSNQNANQSLDNANSSNSYIFKAKNKTATQSEATANWKAYSSKEGQFSLKYPPSWAAATKPELCTAGMLLLGANASSVGVCGSGNVGQIQIVSVEGIPALMGKPSVDYSNVNASDYTLSGVKGTKTTYTINKGPEDLAGHPIGTKVIQYNFTTNGRSYTAVYFGQPNYPDVSKDFELMVTKTLQFKP